MSAPRFGLLVSTCIRHAADIYMRSGMVSTPITRWKSGSALHKTRSFASSSIMHAAPSTPTYVPKSAALISSVPTADELKAQELDLDIIPKEDIKLELTNRAAEQLQSIATREHTPSAGLRIAVESGGCHGYQYTMELASERNVEDYHFTHPAIVPSNIYIDAVSLGLLNGSTIDFATELIGSSFRIAENPQAKGGCGCGISWEMKD
ncbi:uncharacterized protein F5147DRAFT_745874 [Suillus discolor]|uniref:Core domain-containing protein n=1 Tax=Suillus discolor TaxID=1912936 RepID=A0A9P7F6E1_9AGAM|nr:uncharacterized protein F5147DRAFT_745874 [Suillus discolor]KAG2108024.1 hypothetical protein F5147DRAFT_745874 [Suillus discolor]